MLCLFENYALIINKCILAYPSHRKARKGRKEGDALPYLRTAIKNYDAEHG
jgi:hypothetical protein